MQLFVSLNILFLFLTFSLLLIVIILFRHLLIKPSIVVILFFHVQVQWASTIKAQEIYSYLPEPYMFLILVHGFPLIGLLGSLLTFRSFSLQTFERIKDEPYQKNNRLSFAFMAVILAILFLYLSFVPLKSTGLYTILFNTNYSTVLAREESLKLLNMPYIKYAYTFLRSVFAPILAVLVFHNLLHDIRQRDFSAIVINLLLLLLVFFSVMLPGDRIAAANILLVIIFSYFLKKGMPIKPHYILIAAISVLLIPVVLSILREGKSVNIGLVFEYLTTGIFNRVFIVPMQTGLWHVHYAQTIGFFGVEGIPKLASLYNLESLNVANIIYHQYTHGPIPSGLANTSFVFSYFSFFGLPSLIISLIGLWLLDIMVYAYRFLPASILLPSVSAVFISSMRFIETEYTTALLSGGFILIPLAAILFVSFTKIRLYKNTFSHRNEE